MNDVEIKRLADHIADAGVVLQDLGQQIRRATNEEDCRQMIAKAIDVTAEAHHQALDMNSESVARQKIVGVADAKE